MKLFVLIPLGGLGLGGEVQLKEKGGKVIFSPSVQGPHKNDRIRTLCVGKSKTDPAPIISLEIKWGLEQGQIEYRSRIEN